MPRFRRPRYADVTATLALVLALGTGGAYAATSLVSTGQIANGAVTTAKIHNGAVTSAKLAPPVRNQLSSLQSQLNNAFTPWGTIQSGKTVVGQFFNTGFSGTATWYHEENVSLPAATPVPLDDSHIAFGTTVGGTTANTNCTGTYSHPTAPRGWVCVYLGYTTGFGTPAVRLWNDPALRTHAFYVEFPESATNTKWDEYGTWAYTAP